MAKKSCDPLYQQALLFDEGPQGKVLQVSGTGEQADLEFTLGEVLDQNALIHTIVLVQVSFL